MLIILRLLISILILNFSISELFAADIPIIVIAPSKKAQSISTVGSSVMVYDQEYLDNNEDFFLGDILSDGSSINFNQSGGAGTISGIQLRGLPKALSLIHI